MSLCEILAPAGSRDSLAAAVRCGADAVYLGGKSLNARRNADNFDETQLLEAVSYCHVRGVQVYLTLNTLVYDKELDEAERAVGEAAAAGVDAVIVQDLAVAGMIRRCAPSLPIHASTQMSVHDADGVAQLAELGFSRVVLARELTREEICGIRDANPAMELECFVHGALCMSVSGQCYLSSVIGGRSGNRGLCAQPCRLPFQGGGRECALSLKDLTLIPRATELAELGIKALKIEGRMKRPEYVAAAVTACRQALAGEEPDYRVLEAVFSRSGFTAGYYEDKRGRDMFGIRAKENVQAAATVLKQLAALYQKERQALPVAMEFTLRAGEPVTLRVTDADGNTALAEGPVPEAAVNAPTTAGRAEAALTKTGGTPFTVCNLSSKIDDGLIVTASRLNALRRDTLTELEEKRGKIRPHPFLPTGMRTVNSHAGTEKPRIRVRLARAAQLTESLARQADEIVVPLFDLDQIENNIQKVYLHKIIIEIPGVLFVEQGRVEEQMNEAKRLGIRCALAGGLGGIRLARRHGFTVCGDYGLNITNGSALEAYRALGLADATLSFELELQQIRAMGGALPRGILAYGHLPLMVPRNCPVGDCGNCGDPFPQLTDRLGNRFFVDCSWKVPRLYNHLPLYMGERLREIRGVDFLTLYYTRETPEECAAILEKYTRCEPYEGPMTRGLYYRKVL